MQQLSLPQFSISVKDTDSTKLIFDIVRRKWVANTPEEWVRQNIIHYLVHIKNFPLGLISVEHSFELENRKKFRADIVVFNNKLQPILVVECKSPSVKISSDTLSQIAKYNSVLKSKNIFVSNGLTHYFLSTENFLNYNYSNSLPDYTLLIKQYTDSI